MFKDAEKYIARRSANLDNHPISHHYDKLYDIIIVIPSYAEFKLIKATLDSIQNQAVKHTFLVIIVINNEVDRKDNIFTNNKKTHDLIKRYIGAFDINAIDCYSDGNCIDEKKFGVGYARKIGLDIAIRNSHKDTILCWLDADTTVENNYMDKLIAAYKMNNNSSLITNFKHQSNIDESLNTAINEYELFLKKTSTKMKESGSIYKYVPLGPTISCTASTYIAVGGLTPHKATEDFYFIQDLCKYGNVMYADDIIVHPSSRISERVYLGTGYRMSQISKQNYIKDLYFTDKSFKVLNGLLALTKASYKSSLETYFLNLHSIDIKLLNFMKSIDIECKWTKIIDSSPSADHFEMQFQRYFDWLKTIKLLKYYS